MVRLICPCCGDPMEIDEQELEILTEEEIESIICEECFEEEEEYHIGHIEIDEDEEDEEYQEEEEEYFEEEEELDAA